MGVGCATRARGAVGSAQFYDLDSIRVQNETKTAQNINGNASAETPQNTPNHSTRAIKTGQRGAGRAGGGPCRVWEGFTKIRVFRPPCRPASPPELDFEMETATIYTKLHLTVQNVHTVELPPKIASRPEPFTAS